MSLILLLIGYGSFAVIVIRSNANTPLDENDPENLVTLHSYLKREQYGSAPLLFGQHWNSKENERELWKDQGPVLLRRFVVVKNDKDIKAFIEESRANDYASKEGGYVEEKYYESNASNRKNSLPTYAQSTFFPRMYWSQEPRRIAGYKAWSGYDASDRSGGEVGTDGQRLPTFRENMRYFTEYQVKWMYWRYFMWNFAGRQNDIQGHGDAMRGNWLSGIRSIDEMRLGNQSEHAPYFTAQNAAYNKFYLLPLILGFIGLIFHFYRAPKDAFVVFLAFLFTGVAIVVYLNQKPFEPRERDYAFAGSFYFFAMWIGIGVYALYDAFKSFGKKEIIRIAIIGGAGAFLMIFDSMAATLTWFTMLGIAALLIGVMMLLRKVLKSDSQGASLVTLLALAVPLLMAVQGWDDHDRSHKTSAHDLAYNYLNSCAKNGIMFTNGDNDTFPLWYMQEVEGKRTDVRVCNLSLMQTDWYTNQMKMKAYDSEPLPIKFDEDQIMMYSGATDHVLFSSLFDLTYVGASPAIRKRIIGLRIAANEVGLDAAVNKFNAAVTPLVAGAKATNPKLETRLRSIKLTLTGPLAKNKIESVYDKFDVAVELFNAARNRLVEMDRNALVALQDALTAFENDFGVTNLADAMAFVRDDKNIVTFEGQRRLRVFPSSTFNLPVNADNAVKSKIITAKEKDDCLDKLTFKFTQSGISREQVMMLDILANNDWARPIYFSSPGGSEVALSLLRGMNGRDGYIKQNGMAFELSPLDNQSGSVNRDQMYKNLMETYSFGEMNNEKVLTDYYARRHTGQYRSHFLRLAEDFVGNALMAEEEISRGKMMNEMNPDFEVPPPSLSEEEIKDFKKKAIALLKRSLDVMPPEIVIDYGEPTENTNPRKDYQLNGRTFKAWNDGNLHEYVRLLYMAGDKKSANELGMKLADQLETIITYFEKSDIGITASQQNTPDLYAAVENYFQISIAAADDELGDPQGKLAARTAKYVHYMNTSMFPGMLNRLKEKANQNGETTSRRGGYYASMYHDLNDYVEAIFTSYGVREASTPPPTNSAPPVMPGQGLPGGLGQ